jgi:hypothetical protein
MSNLIIETTLNLWQNGRKIRRTGNGWLSGNAVCCENNGQSRDSRGRGGIIVENGKLSWHCFNCEFKTSYTEGRMLNQRYKNLLLWLGADKTTVDKLSLEAIRVREESMGATQYLNKVQTNLEIKFKTTHLPDDSELLDSNNPAHKLYTTYLKSRGLATNSYTYYVTPTAEGRDVHRIIIPYYYNGQLVGNTSRYLDDRKPKYISDQQRGYVFNIDAQKKDWQACIMVEGQFDAIAIGGCAYMGSTIIDEQANVISRLRRKIIVVPDRDKTGMEVCNRALELGYHISIPAWAEDVKDVNDAVQRYGRLATTMSILQAATSSRIKVEMIRKKIT